jgi:hypothetical protein
MNGPKDNEKKMKWFVEPIGILLLYDVLFEEEGEAHLAVQFNLPVEPVCQVLDRLKQPLSQKPFPGCRAEDIIGIIEQSL